MHSKVELPKAFSVRDEHEFLPIQHLMTRLNPQFVVKLVAVHRSMTSKGGSVTLVGVGPEIREILALTKLDQLFSVRSTEANTPQ